MCAIPQKEVMALSPTSNLSVEEGMQKCVNTVCINSLRANKSLLDDRKHITRWTFAGKRAGNSISLLNSTFFIYLYNQKQANFLLLLA